MDQTSEQLQAQIEALTLKLTKVKEQEAKEAETLKIFTDKVDAANSKIEVLIDSIIEETGLKLKDLHYRKKTALEISGKTSETSKPSTSNTDKKPRKISEVKFACIDNAGGLQTVITSYNKFWKSKSPEFINEHKVTHRKLVDGKSVFWNEKLGTEKPDWATDDTLADIKDYVQK